MNKEDIIGWFKSSDISLDEKMSILKDVADSVKTEKILAEYETEEDDDYFDDLDSEFSKPDSEFIKKQQEREKNEREVSLRIDKYLNELSKNEKLVELRKTYNLRWTYKIINPDDMSVTIVFDMHKKELYSEYRCGFPPIEHSTVTVLMSEGDELFNTKNWCNLYV